jgi:hypothetical protein
MPAPIIVAFTFKRGAVGGCGSAAARTGPLGTVAAVAAAAAFAFAGAPGLAAAGAAIIMVPLKRPGAAFFSATGNS